MYFLLVANKTKDNPYNYYVDVSEYVTWMQKSNMWT